MKLIGVLEAQNGVLLMVCIHGLDVEVINWSDFEQIPFTSKTRFTQQPRLAEPKMISKVALHFIRFLDFCPFLTSTSHPSPACSQCPLLLAETAPYWGFSSFLSRQGWKGPAEIQYSSCHLLPCCLIQTLILFLQPFSSSKSRMQKWPPASATVLCWGLKFRLMSSGKGWSNMSACDFS